MSGATSGNSRDLPYRLGVGAALFNANGRVFVGQRAGGRFAQAWQMPQGGIHDGETPAEAVMRELVEETGTDKAAIMAETRDWLSYDLPDDLMGVAWDGRFRGQKQKWFALRFTGRDGDIDVDADGKPEFSDWRWAEFARLPEMIVPFKRGLYRQLVTEFGDLPAKIAAGER